MTADGREVEVDVPAGVARWLSAQEHYGENIGTTDTHTVFVELKEAAPRSGPGSTLGPS